MFKFANCKRLPMVVFHRKWRDEYTMQPRQIWQKILHRVVSTVIYIYICVCMCMTYTLTYIYIHIHICIMMYYVYIYMYYLCIYIYIIYIYMLILHIPSEISKSLYIYIYILKCLNLCVHIYIYPISINHHKSMLITNYYQLQFISTANISNNWQIPRNFWCTTWFSSQK